MIIHQPERIQKDGCMAITAPVAWERVGNDSSIDWYQPPETLHFKFDQKYTNLLTERSDSFLVGLLPVAMYFNEPVRVEGSVSKKLAYLLEEYQRTLNFWRPEWFQVVPITYNSLVDSGSSAGTGAVCSFSGGVDSSYTLYTHRPGHAEYDDAEVRYAMYIRGFSNNIETSQSFDIKSKAFSELVQTVGVQFVDITTNVREFQKLDAENGTHINYFIFNSVLAASALFFQEDIKYFHFSADNTHDFMLLSVINHFLVPLLSTELIQSTVCGASTSKIEKLSTLSNWNALHSKLVVCDEEPDGVSNCGNCVKCYATMTALDMTENLHLFSTLPDKVPRWRLLGTRHRAPFIYFPRKWMQFARETKRYDYYVIYAWVYVMSILKMYTSNIKIPLPSMRHLYAVSSFLKKHVPGYSTVITMLKT